MARLIVKSLSIHAPAARPSRRAPRRGFTFLEVLFAVMILGIGMIMVAAMFPAGIRQTQANVEDSAYMALSRDLARQMQGMAQEKLPSPPPTGFNYAFDYYMRPYPIPSVTTATPFYSLYKPIVYSFHDPRPAMSTYRTQLYNWVRGNLVVDSDPTYAYAVLFSRQYNLGAGSVDAAYKDESSVTLYVLPMRARTVSSYSVARDTAFGNGRYSRLDPVLINVNLTLQTTAASSTVQLAGIVPGSGTPPTGVGITAANNPVEEGAYMVLSDMNGTLSDGTPAAKYNGTIYRIGARVNANGDTLWSLAPDKANGPFPSTPNVTFGGLAFIVGRGPSTAGAGPAATFTRAGSIQELGVLPTSIGLTLK